MSLSDQFYSQLREAMFANKLSASDLAQRKGVHYTYVYNTVRKNANITIKTAEELADAAGYTLQITFVPKAESAELKGDMDPSGPIFSARRKPGAAPAAKAEAQPEVEGEVVTEMAATLDPEDGVAEAVTLDQEIEALLNA